MADTPSTTAVVPVKSAWASKINWTQVLAFASMLLATKGINLDPETQTSILAGIIGAQAAVTWVLKTWFTATVTAASVAK